MAHETAGEPRWRRRPADRPREILDAALEVFRAAGLAGARIEDIAERAGLSKGTVYHYFPSKDHLFRELIRQTVRDVTVGALPDGTQGGPRELLSAFMHGLWAYMRTPRFGAVYRLVQGELHQFPELAEFYAREVAGQTARFAGEMVRRGTAAGEFRQVDPDAAGRMLLAMFTQHAVWCGRRELFTHLAGRSDEQVLADLEDFFFHALAP